MPAETVLAYRGNEERVLVLLPDGRDARSIPAVLATVGVTSRVCAGAEEVCAEIDQGAGALLLEAGM